MAYDSLDQRTQVKIGSTSPRTFDYDGDGRLISEIKPSAGAVPVSFAEHVWLDPNSSGAEGWQPLALAGGATS